MIDVLPPAQMARWLRETARSTRTRGEAPWTEQETRVAGSRRTYIQRTYN